MFTYLKTKTSNLLLGHRFVYQEIEGNKNIESTTPKKEKEEEKVDIATADTIEQNIKDKGAKEIKKAKRKPIIMEPYTVRPMSDKDAQEYAAARGYTEPMEEVNLGSVIFDTKRGTIEWAEPVKPKKKLNKKSKKK